MLSFRLRSQGCHLKAPDSRFVHLLASFASKLSLRVAKFVKRFDRTASIQPKSFGRAE